MLFYTNMYLSLMFLDFEQARWSHRIGMSCTNSSPGHVGGSYNPAPRLSVVVSAVCHWASLGWIKRTVLPWVSGVEVNKSVPFHLRLPFILQNCSSRKSPEIRSGRSYTRLSGKPREGFVAIRRSNLRISILIRLFAASGDNSRDVAFA